MKFHTPRLPLQSLSNRCSISLLSHRDARRTAAAAMHLGSSRHSLGSLFQLFVIAQAFPSNLNFRSRLLVRNRKTNLLHILSDHIPNILVHSYEASNLRITVLDVLFHLLMNF